MFSLRNKKNIMWIPLLSVAMRDVHSDLGPCYLFIHYGLLTCETDHVTVIRDLGQHVSSAQTDWHPYPFINYNAKNANAHGHASFRLLFFFP